MFRFISVVDKNDKGGHDIHIFEVIDKPEKLFTAELTKDLILKVPEDKHYLIKGEFSDLDIMAYLIKQTNKIRRSMK